MTARVATSANERLARLYAVLVEDEDARVCREIPDSACRWVPYNFFVIGITGVLTRLGDELTNPKTVIVWLLGLVGAPVAFVGFLVPIRESGSMIPQMVIAAWVRRLALRKWMWVAGSVLQGLAVLGIGAAAWALQGATAGWAIIAFLVVFSLARGLCSVSHKDVIGKTIPKTRRGRLGGYTAAASGGLTLLVGLVLLRSSAGTTEPAFYGGLVAAAGVAWFLAAALFATLPEEPGATEGGRNGLTEAFKRLDLLRTDTAFARFTLVRALFLVSALTAPYYIVLADGGDGMNVTSLGVFIVANGLATGISAPVWGRMADRSSKNVMLTAAAVASVLGVAVAGWAVMAPADLQTPWVYAAAFLVLGVAHSGVRLGRKTYVVDLAGGNRRTDYVAVGNSVIGVVLLAGGLLGLLAALISPAGVIAVFAALGFVGVALGRRLPETQ